jgi:hypothetical protein
MIITNLVAAGIGFVVGAFMPAVGREIKSWFVKETKTALPTVTAVETAIKTDVSAVAKKL